MILAKVMLINKPKKLESLLIDLLSDGLLVISATSFPWCFNREKEKQHTALSSFLSEQRLKFLLQFSMQHELQTMVTYSRTTTENQNTALNSLAEKQCDPLKMADKQSSFPELYAT